MEHVGSIFYARRVFELDARLDYAVLVNGKSTLDALNPRTLFSGTAGGEVSELVMPAHRLPLRRSCSRWFPRDVGGRAGALGRAKVTIYLPPAYEPVNRYQTIYTADGSAWTDLIGLPVILDNMIAGRVTRRGGRAKRYFRITAKGLRQVRETRRALIRLWQRIPEFEGGTT